MFGCCFPGTKYYRQERQVVNTMSTPCGVAELGPTFGFVPQATG